MDGIETNITGHYNTGTGQWSNNYESNTTMRARFTDAEAGEVGPQDVEVQAIPEGASLKNFNELFNEISM